MSSLLFSQKFGGRCSLGMIQLVNNADRDTTVSFYSTILSMVLFLSKPVTSLLQDGCYISKQHILTQSRKQERGGQKGLSSQVSVIFIQERNLSCFHYASLARVGSRAHLYTNHC